MLSDLGEKEMIYLKKGHLKHTAKHITALAATVAMTMAFTFPTDIGNCFFMVGNTIDASAAAVYDLTVTGGEINKDYTYENKLITVLTSAPITVSGTTKTDKIKVADGVSANITLSGVDIDVSQDSFSCAFMIEDNSTGKVTVTLENENVLKSGYGAGLQKSSSESLGQLTINGNGSLTAIGAGKSAGIGGKYGGKGTNITISSGTVIANGGDSGAGIGGGYNGSAYNITVNGGNVIATGGVNGAGIGGGDGSGNGGAASNITIRGGTVTANGGKNAAGIGGGYFQTGSSIKICGGSVKAAAGTNANAFGGGYGKKAFTPTLDDGTARVYLLKIENTNNEPISIDGQNYLPVNHSSYYINDTALYAYLSADEHTVKVGSNKTAAYKYSSKKNKFMKVPSAEDFEFIPPDGTFYDGNPKTAVVRPAAGVNGMGNITVKYYDESNTEVTAPLNIGTYTVRITVEEGTNHLASVGELEIGKFSITKKIPDITLPSAAAITYGEPLASSALTSGWSWVDDTVIPTVSNSGYAAKMSVTDYDRYDYSKLKDCTYDENAHIITVCVPLTVYKASIASDMFVFSAPAKPVYDGTDKTVAVTAKNGINGIGYIALKYYANGKEVQDTAVPNTYTVMIDVSEGENFSRASNITDAYWKFTVTAAQQAKPDCELTIRLEDDGTYTAEIAAVMGAEYRFNSGKWGSSNTLSGIGHAENVTAFIRMKATSTHNASDISYDTKTTDHGKLAHCEAVLPNCIDDGNIEYWTDELCGKYFSDASGRAELTDITAPAKGHNWDTAYDSNETHHWHNCQNASCPMTDITHKDGYALHIHGAEATENTSQTCTECGYELAPAAGHIHNKHLMFIDAVPETCTADGAAAHYECSCGGLFKDALGTVSVTAAELIIPARHIYSKNLTSDNDEDHFHICTVCNERADISAHIYNGGVITVQPSAASEGVKVFTCSECGHTKTEAVPRLEHKHSFAAEYSADASGHFRVCSGCNEKLDFSAHTYGEWQVTVPASSDADGKKLRSCTVCGYEEEAAVKYENYDAEKAAAEVASALDDLIPNNGTTAEDIINRLEKLIDDENITVGISETDIIPATEDNEGSITVIISVTDNNGNSEEIKRVLVIEKLPSSKPESIVYYPVTADGNVSVNTASAQAGQTVSVSADLGYDIIITDADGRQIARITEKGSFIMPAGRVYITAVRNGTFAAMSNSWNHAYVYSYDSNMDRIKVSTDSRRGAVTIKLGKEYSGREFVIYRGRKNTKLKITEGVFDAKGNFTFNAEYGKNYTLVIK